MKSILSLLLLMALASCSEGFQEKDPKDYKNADSGVKKEALSNKLAEKYDRAQMTCLVNVDKFFKTGGAVESVSEVYVLNDFLKEAKKIENINFSRKITNSLRLTLKYKLALRSDYNGTVATKEGDNVVVYGYKNSLNLKGSLSGSVIFMKSESQFKSSVTKPRVDFYENQDLVIRKASTKEVKEKGGKEAQYDIEVICSLETDLKGPYQSDNTVTIK